MSLRGQLAFVIDAARNAFRDDPDTTEECADALYRYLTRPPWNDHVRTQPYYVGIVRFVREYQPHDPRIGGL